MPDKVTAHPWAGIGETGRHMATDISTAAMHGRDDLLALAERRLGEADAGAGQLLLLSGEAGIGKTRLLRALQDRAAERGFELWSAAAFPQDVELSAGLMLDLGHAMARADRPEASARGEALVADLADAGDHPGSGDAHRRRRLLVLDAAERLASLADDGPALLALEDLHWCDELSLEIVAHLARRLRTLPLLVAATIRTDELHQNAPVRAWRSRMLLQRLAEEARLARLDQAQTDRMVRDLLPGQRVGQRLVSLVHRRSGGVPLHIEELVNAAAHGHLTTDPSYVPETLAEAIQQRFETLSSTARDHAVAAAVIGRTFDLDLLATVSGSPHEEVADSLDELVDRQFVNQEPAAAWFGFRHALIRDTIETSAPRALRRALHARVAEVARTRTELGGDAYRSAHHEAAGQTEEASAAAAAAARRATALSAHQEAFDLLNRALRCLPADAPGQRVELLVLRAAEAAATDHNAQAADDFEQARELLAAAGDDVAAAALLPGLVAARHLLGAPLPVRVGLLDDGLRAVGQAPPGAETERVRASLLSAKAAAYLVDDRLDDAIAAGEDALAAAGEQDERTWLDTVATLGSVLVFAGRMEEGWAPLERAVKTAVEVGAEAEAARGYRMIGSSASTLVEYDRAERWLDEGIGYADRTEQWNHLHYMVSHRAHVWWCTGRWDDADREIQRLLSEGEGGITTRITALHVAGFVALGRGAFGVAAEALGEARAVGEEMGELQRYSPAIWGLAECAVLRGDHAAGIALTERGYQASHEVADASNLFPYLVTGTRARLAGPDPASASAWVDDVGSDISARGIPGTLPAVDHAAGLVELAAGRTGKARDLLQAAHAAWKARRRWWEAQWCALDLARCALSSNRRTDAATLVEGVRVAAAAVAAEPLLAAAAELGARLDHHDAAQPWSPLTLREFEVARAVARGLTNREIAEELRITTRTAGSHLEHIRAKLGAGRRSEIAAWVTSLNVADEGER